ncbi:MAG: hypothetical protein SGJ05_01930 [bacterium]|nr:hypothetical protein [bacterium]
MSRVLILSVVVLLSASCLFAQQVQTSSQQGSLTGNQDMVIIKPKLALADIRGVSQFLESVEIRGTEVDAYLDVKKALNAAIESGTKSNSKPEELVVVEMRMDVANNFYVLMQRATLKGAEAEKFRQIIVAVQEAAKAATAKK